MSQQIYHDKIVQYIDSVKIHSDAFNNIRITFTDSIFHSIGIIIEDDINIASTPDYVYPLLVSILDEQTYDLNIKYFSVDNYMFTPIDRPTYRTEDIGTLYAICMCICDYTEGIQYYMLISKDERTYHKDMDLFANFVGGDYTADDDIFAKKVVEYRPKCKKYSHSAVIKRLNKRRRNMITFEHIDIDRYNILVVKYRSAPIIYVDVSYTGKSDTLMDNIVLFMSFINIGRKEILHRLNMDDMYGIVYMHNIYSWPQYIDMETIFDIHVVDRCKYIAVRSYSGYPFAEHVIYCRVDDIVDNNSIAASISELSSRLKDNMCIYGPLIKYIDKPREYIHAAYMTLISNNIGDDRIIDRITFEFKYKLITGGCIIFNVHMDMMDNIPMILIAFALCGVYTSQIHNVLLLTHTNIKYLYNNGDSSDDQTTLFIHNSTTMVANDNIAHNGGYVYITVEDDIPVIIVASDKITRKIEFTKVIDKRVSKISGIMVNNKVGIPFFKMIDAHKYDKYTGVPISRHIINDKDGSSYSVIKHKEHDTLFVIKDTYYGDGMTYYMMHLYESYINNDRIDDIPQLEYDMLILHKNKVWKDYDGWPPIIHIDIDDDEYRCIFMDGL